MNSSEIYSGGCIWKVSIGLGHSLTMNEQHAITQTNDDPVYLSQGLHVFV